MSQLMVEGPKKVQGAVLAGEGRLQRTCNRCGMKDDDAVKGILQRSAVHNGPEHVPPIVHEVLRSSGRPLDKETREFMEPRFRHDFSQVRVHTDTKSAESARAVNALAYTVGRDVVFNGGRYAPSTTAGKRLLAHELTHVVQQGGHPGLQYSRIQVGSQNEIPEHQANEAAERIIQTRQQGPVSRLNYPVLQREVGGPPRRTTGGLSPSPVPPIPAPPTPTPQSPEIISSETSVTSPGARTRTTIGVGEEVILTHSPGSAAWTSTAGTLSPLNGVTVRYTAPDIAQPVMVMAGGASIRFSVTAPETVTMVLFPGRGVRHTLNQPDSGIITNVFLGPDTVNFHNVRYREQNVAGLVTSPGVYSCNPARGGHCVQPVGGACRDKGLSREVVAGRGTRAIIYDCVYSSYCPGVRSPFVPGTMKLMIPYEYKVSTGPFIHFTTVRVEHRLHSNATTLTTEKAGATGTTQVANATVTHPECTQNP